MWSKFIYFVAVVSLLPCSALSDYRYSSSIAKIILGNWRNWRQKLSKKTSLEQEARLFDQLPADQESYYTAPQIIAHRGYPVEVHKVTTDDGYILELHRIPSSNSSKKAVFLQHGVLDSSAVWITNPTTRALAFLLAEKGYDVWMGNNRGNRYSKDHTTLNPNGKAFWKFTWDDYGNYDLPGAINYILSLKGQSSLIYTGHSLGCGQFWIAMIQHPELMAKIDLMVALAPLSSFQHFRDPLRLLIPFYWPLQAFLKLMGTRQFLNVENGLLRQLLRIVCEATYFQARICRLVYMIMAGPNTQNLDVTLIPLLNSNALSGTSVNVISQFAQNNLAGEVFQAYDYGFIGNKRRYGTFKPLKYDLKKITVPVYVFAGSNDWIVAPKDVLWLDSVLGNLKQSITIDGYNHIDFLWGTDVKEKLYDQVLALLPSP